MKKDISKWENNPILPVQLVTISVGSKRKRKSVFSCLNVQPSFKKLKSDYLDGVKEELWYRSSLNTATLTYTLVTSETETHTSNIEWPKIEVETNCSKKIYGKKRNNFLQAMSTETILGRLYDKLNASRCVKDFMSIVENLAEGGIPMDNI